MSAIVVDRDGELVLGHSEEQKLDSVLDFESTGRRETSAKALHLLARGSHVSGFILRPDDGLSDVAVVCNGATRFLSAAEFQWLMHESKTPITACPSDELERVKDAAREVVWSWHEATGHSELPQLPMVSRAAMEEAITALGKAVGL